MAITAPSIPIKFNKMIFIKILIIEPNAVVANVNFSFLIEFKITPVRLFKKRKGKAKTSIINKFDEEIYLLP